MCTNKQNYLLHVLVADQCGSPITDIDKGSIELYLNQELEEWYSELTLFGYSLNSPFSPFPFTGGIQIIF